MLAAGGDPVASGGGLEEGQRGLGQLPSRRSTSPRSNPPADNVKLHVDQVAGLGSFVEVEAIDRDGTHSRHQLHGQCRRWLEDLGIDQADLIPVSYSDLLLATRRLER